MALTRRGGGVLASSAGSEPLPLLRGEGEGGVSGPAPAGRLGGRVGPWR